MARQLVPQPPGLPPTWAPVHLGEGMVGENEPLILACSKSTKHFQSQTLSPSDVGRHCFHPPL